MSILDQINRVAGHIDDQTSIIDEIIALVETKMTGGGGNNISWGITTVTSSASDKTIINIPHNLGVQPEFVALAALPYSSTAPDLSSGGILAVAYQTVATTLSSATGYAFYSYMNSSGVLTSKRVSISGNTTYVSRGNTTDTVYSSALGVNFIAAPAAVRYVWIAVASN